MCVCMCVCMYVCFRTVKELYETFSRGLLNRSKCKYNIVALYLNNNMSAHSSCISHTAHAEYQNIYLEYPIQAPHHASYIHIQYIYISQRLLVTGARCLSGAGPPAVPQLPEPAVPGRVMDGYRVGACLGRRRARLVRQVHLQQPRGSLLLRFPTRAAILALGAQKT